jgi:hypothetical protein
MLHASLAWVNVVIQIKEALQYVTLPTHAKGGFQQSQNFLHIRQAVKYMKR